MERDMVIELNPTTDKRKLFQLISRDNYGNPFEDFSPKMVSRTDNDYFHINLVSNPFLTLVDIGIACYLHLILWETTKLLGGAFFWTAKSEQPKAKVDFEYIKHGASYDCKAPFKNLREELKKHHIIMTNESMIKSLRKLHSCGYITVTTKHGKGVSGDDSKSRSEFRHIDINNLFVNRKMQTHWKSKSDIKSLNELDW
ncbi:hypothetical protein TUM4261_32060 [Shewanella sp. c952]|uniref:hypothetical protein n=1 Tax=Shewanella sp. c952 TaxID=2815913 RepID=UPI001BC5EB6D|nr:hypothetical protein [Shewanella sp. c952]GIU15314.1 hypothetical protein TUM4261_32060 [Shewanella sp. c952]